MNANRQAKHPRPQSQPGGGRTLADVAAALDAPLTGDGSLLVREIVHPAMASAESDLAFVMEQRLVGSLAGGPVRAAVVAEGIEVPAGLLAGHVSVPDPRYALAILLDLFEKPVHAPEGVHPSAVVEPTAALGEGVSIGALSYVGPGAEIGPNSIVMPHVTVGAQARIGADCLLHSGVRIGERVVIGNRVIIQHNAAIGADGFSYVTEGEPSFEVAKRRIDRVEVQNLSIRRINSIGTVIVGDDVEIGANAAIDRANIGATTIGDGTKIDNLVMIAHNNSIGSNCLMSGQVGISGSCRIGDRVVLAGQTGVADHLSIGDDAVVAAGSGIWRDVGDKEIVGGYPALPKREALEREANIRRLSRVLRDLEDLRKRIVALEAGR